MTASLVPAFEDALVAIFTTALPNVTIVQGPVIARSLGKDVAAVGALSDEFTSSATASHNQDGGDWGGWSAGTTQTLSVPCSLHSTSGGEDVKARRDAVAAMLTAIDTAIRADRTLGDLLVTCVISEERWVYAADSQGVACDLAFVVSGVALV